MACYSHDTIGRGIRWATCSPFGPRELRWPPSHVAIICDAPEVDDEPVWVESTTQCEHPCLVRGETVSGVQVHRPAERIRDYEQCGGRVELFRLTEINTFSSKESRLLSRILIDHFARRGLQYDYTGALFSGTRVFPWTRLFPAVDLHSMFCSKMVAAVLMRLNRMNHENPTLFNPGRLLRRLVHTGKYALVADRSAIRT